MGDGDLVSEVAGVVAGVAATAACMVFLSLLTYPETHVLFVVISVASGTGVCHITECVTGVCRRLLAGAPRSRAVAPLSIA